MQIDASAYADQLAYYEVYAAQNRYSTQLSTLQSQNSMLGKIDNALDALDNILYKFTKPKGTLAQSAVTQSSEEFFSVNAAGYAKNINMDIFVEQTAASHQIAVNATGTETSDIFAVADGKTTLTVNFDGVDKEITLGAEADDDGDGNVSYQEMVNYFNKTMDGGVSASLVRSSGDMKLLFSSEETGVANQFTVTASHADTGELDAFTTANQKVIKEGRDAIIWMGDYGSGIELTNSSNTFENVVNGVDITIAKANAAGDDTTNFSIGPDSAATIETLNEFVAAYNEALKVLNEATRSGSETEERGVLASDGSIRGITSELKNLIRTSYNGVSLFEVGLSLNKEGELELDAEKFDEASELYDLDAIFVGEGGLFKTMESTVEKYADYNTGSLKTKRDRNSLQQERVNDKLDELDTKYEMYYRRYLTQFTSLNNMMYSMNSISTLFA
ncbi:flagellar filament capping protein FliD [Vibrio diazotrophicus]|uniref:flagellar filament capping protein FliD n=1 Tax=Vibrio TaxID=662 RepID=UPI001F00B252|nr:MULTISPECIES: flagellar filament capping protein FliD [Vibrio]MCF7362838.1 flagellar filament capping protein FliD [Vibrio sp. A1-b2]MCZ4372041.1 flagellar filament capping protein FliD [Vibrio diazotrophicus]